MHGPDARAGPQGPSFGTGRCRLRQALRTITALTAAAVLAGCGAGGQEPPQLENPRQRDATQGTIGDMFGRDSLFGGRSTADDTGMSVNRHLWSAALDTLAFLPLVSTDPFSGVIVTDWSTPAESPDERFKVNVVITQPTLTASALRVAVFREVRRNGEWVSAEVAEATPRRLEDAILTRARQLRVADLERGRRAG